jgi:hypothetical protein
MKDSFLLEAEPYEAETQAANFESFDTELADEEWEDEFRRFGRMSGRAPRPRMRGAPPRRPPQRRPGPPKRLIRRPQRSPRRPPRSARRAGWPTDSIREPVTAAPVEQRSEYVRWVQISLNQVLGLRLPITGVMNAAARSALRTFQGQQNLPADGIAGPETRKALIAAKAKPSGRGAEPSPSGQGPEPSQPGPGGEPPPSGATEEPSSSAPSEEPSSSGASQEPSQSEELEWLGGDELEWENEARASKLQTALERLKRIVGSLGLKLSPREMRDLLGGKKISLAARPLSELGGALIRAERLYERQNPAGAPAAGELEAPSGGGKCKGCKGICIAVSERNCLCFGLLSVSYCRRFRYP